jgi:hypothetical protein
MSQSDWPIKKKKVETMEAPQNKDFMERWSASLFGPPI